MTEKQLKFIRVLILKIKTKAEWSSGWYRLHVGDLNFQPFRGNNVLLGGMNALSIEQASWLIKMLKSGLYVVEIKTENNNWVNEEEGVC